MRAIAHELAVWKIHSKSGTGRRVRDFLFTAFCSPRSIVLPIRTSVFVLDDDSSMRVSIKRLLREHGFSATLFESTKALLDHGDFGNAICIIIDVNLNGQSGIDLRRRLANEGVTAPVIYITGNDSQANRSAAIASGCIAYLIKPFTAQSFIESIERARAGAV